ncbi:LemA family protein [Solitalea sp. MAHUQ-68]|uniref:LemA family protein n=1 Tax=Solitalea agri TaxID=2953739 RepID=A0A9X2JDT4_9SPHI|nr:LemA family protein [Solitalea agri]MCO4293260.1 LemA family protein [Solitalea agri]
MKKGTIGIIAILVLIFGMGGCSYNSMARLDQDVKQQWGQVENVYQRRSDLIPNLVNTVKGYANFEKETLTQVIEARSKATAVNVDASKLTPETFQKFQQAQDGLSSALSRLMVVVEKYPDLKANENFKELQAQLEGTENRIATERNKFNESTGNFNREVTTLPGKLFAGMFGFPEKPYFKAQPGSEKAPTVQF